MLHPTNFQQSQWGTFSKEGKKYVGSTYYQEETRDVNEHFKDRGFVYYFPTEGLLQHNDINPKNHLTDVGHVKIASHLLQWVKLILRWNLEPTGEVQSGTTYWNDQQEYWLSFGILKLGPDAYLTFVHLFIDTRRGVDKLQEYIEDICRLLALYFLRFSSFYSKSVEYVFNLRRTVALERGYDAIRQA